MDLVHPIREALVTVLSEGTWDDIAADHARVGLAWRADLRPGSGKPKYVGRVLAEIEDDAIIELAQRCLHTFPDRAEPTVQDTLWNWEASGVQHLSVITRRKLVDGLDGHRMHPDFAAADFLMRFTHQSGYGIPAYDYLKGSLVRCGSAFESTLTYFLLDPPQPSPPSPPIPATHHELFEDFGYLEWPDQRMFRVLEALVHPTTRKGREQIEWVGKLNDALATDDFELREVERLSGHSVFAVKERRRGTQRHPKNLIFASTGPKPELGFRDAIDNDVVILSNAEHCLIYDEPVGDEGLTWAALVAWWARIQGQDPADKETRKLLGQRLLASTASPPERLLFGYYFRAYPTRLGERLPALLPQVYLHYDPASLRQLRHRNLERRFPVQRMDFLMLFPGGARVVLEVDGQQHYATGMGADAKPSPSIYAETVRSDRELRLAGYEVYRFGGYELSEARTDATARSFFDTLLARHRLLV